MNEEKPSRKAAITRPGTHAITGKPHGELNVGGNHGNVYGGGGKKKIIREKLQDLSDQEAIPFLAKVITGEIEIEVRAMDGTTYMRKPNIRERLDAAKEVVKQSLGASVTEEETTEGRKILVIDI